MDRSEMHTEMDFIEHVNEEHTRRRIINSTDLGNSEDCVGGMTAVLVQG